MDIMKATGLTASGAVALRKLMHETDTDGLPGVLSDMLEHRTFRNVLRWCSELKQTARSLPKDWRECDLEAYVNEEIERLGILERAKEDLQMDHIPAICICTKDDYFDFQRSRIVQDFSFLLDALIRIWEREDGD